MILVLGVWTFLRARLGRSTAATLENVALRHQLMVLQQSIPRPRLRRQDRILWVCLSRLWANWRPSLLIVQPATVVARHRPEVGGLHHRYHRGLTVRDLRLAAPAIVCFDRSVMRRHRHPALQPASASV